MCSFVGNVRGSVRIRICGIFKMLRMGGLWRPYAVRIGCGGWVERELGDSGEGLVYDD